MAENYGRVVQVIGPTVDLEFDSDHLPDILNAIRIADAAKEIDLIVEVMPGDIIDIKRRRRWAIF